jgi:hypothetical protein
MKYHCSENILKNFMANGYYSPIWDRTYESKANDNTNLVRDSMWLYEGIEGKLNAESP